MQGISAYWRPFTMGFGALGLTASRYASETVWAYAQRFKRLICAERAFADRGCPARP
jgi:hypothetical protein